MAQQIFISYSSGDQAVADAVCKSLESCGSAQLSGVEWMIDSSLGERGTVRAALQSARACPESRGRGD